MLNDTTTITVGIDVSKSHLDAYERPSGRPKRFTNNASGFQKLAKWVDPQAHRVVYEPTSRYHRPLEKALVGKLPLARVHPTQARRFAQAQGEKAKTDAVDARMLAETAAALDLPLVELHSQVQQDLTELQSTREALVLNRVTAKNRIEAACHSASNRTWKNDLSHIKREIKKIDAEIDKLIKSDEELSRKYQLLVTIPGVGFITAVGLLAMMPELGNLTPKTVASLAGLAPVTRESGQWKGHSFTSGGRARVRRLLYMSAVSAIRHNPVLSRMYEGMIERGKAPKVALTAAMRKLIVIANALIRDNKPWDPRPARTEDAEPASACPQQQNTDEPRVADGDVGREAPQPVAAAPLEASRGEPLPVDHDRGALPDADHPEIARSVRAVDGGAH